MLERVAASDLCVLILGETGVGKTCTAEMIHARSARASAPYLRLNCGSLSETSMESVLFGYEPGAWPGATHAKPGLLEGAARGTLFLDEVGELPPAIQKKLVRAMEERCVIRAGAFEAHPIDVRFVAATSKDLEAEVSAGRYARDLYVRLNGVSIVLPPLRERAGEIEGLATAAITRLCAARGWPTPALSASALEKLAAHGWPGNLRELENVIERAVLLSGRETILPEHLALQANTPSVPAPSVASEPPAFGPPPSAPPSPSTPPPKADPGGRLLDDLHAFERDRIIAALRHCHGNQTQAAKLLGIARRTLIKRLDLYRIQRPRKELTPVG
jgi:DNA-binding NtrC family response regulator